MTTVWWDVSAVPAFRRTALQFTALIESRAQHSAADLLHQAHVLLPQLYAAALALPDKPEEAFEDVGEDYTPPERDRAELERHQERWRAVYDSVRAQLGERRNYYQEVFDPYATPPEEPVTGSLADDLADIYVDLLRGEDLWAAGVYDEAVWEWRFRFETHWSEHVTGALRAIRTLAAEHDLGFPPPPSA